MNTVIGIVLLLTGFVGFGAVSMFANWASQFEVFGYLMLGAIIAGVVAVMVKVGRNASR